MNSMKKLEVVRLGVKEPDVYRAFIPDVGLRMIEMSKKEIKKYLENDSLISKLKVKKILQIEPAESRFGDYVYFKGGKK